MPEKLLSAEDLAAYAREVRIRAGITQAEAARTLGVSRAALCNAENKPEKSFAALRKRIIEEYSDRTVIGPHYQIIKKARDLVGDRREALQDAHGVGVAGKTHPNSVVGC